MTSGGLLEARAGLAALAAALAAGLVGACGPSRDCEEACAFAERCGLLPSALGGRNEDVSATDNCAARCDSSPAGDRAPVLACLKPKTVNDERAAWCVSDHRTAEAGVCARAARCLRETFRSDSVLGEASVDLRFGEGAMIAAVEHHMWRELPASCGLRPCARDECASPAITCDRSVCMAAPEDPILGWCRAIGVSNPLISLEVGASTLVRPVESCEHLFTQGLTFTGLPAGLVRPRLTIQVPKESSGDRGPPKNACFIMYGNSTLVKAGDANLAFVPLPSKAEILDWPYLCEDSSGTCADGVDNDGDTLRDCGDPDCTAFCSGCTGGRCSQPAPLGSSCKPELRGADCDSGFCVEGLCCETACSGLCVACDSSRTGQANGFCRRVTRCPLEVEKVERDAAPAAAPDAHP